MNIIYKMTNLLNGKLYIGQTWQTLSERFHQHASDKHSIALYNAMKKYGKNQFKIECITICHTQEVADQLEICFIAKYNCSKVGYNIRLGGSRGKHSQQTKDKMSAAALGNTNAIGAVRSSETRMKMAIAKVGNTARLGQKSSVEHKEKMSQALKGRQFSAESKQRMSEAAKKRWSSNA